MLAAFEEYNENIESKSNDETNTDDTVVGSMDAVSLFPNIEATKAAKIVVSEVMKSKAKFEGLDIV